MRSIRSEAGVSVEAAKLAKLAQRLKAASRFHASALPSLWFLTDEERTPDPRAVAARLPTGSGIVLRHYRAMDRNELAEDLAAFARARGLTLLVGADAQLAAKVKAHGVHIPRWAAMRRSGPRPHGFITTSAHGLGEIKRAEDLGADGVFLGPLFATQSHRGAQSLGAVRFFGLARKSSLPVFALGGLSAQNARALNGSGIAGLGAVGGLLPSTD